MSEPLAFLNGEFVPAAQAMLPVFDGGFVQGTTVAEQLRTFGGRLFRVEEHIRRLFHSLSIVEIDPGFTADELAEIAHRLAETNHRLLDPADDLGLAMFVTPGPYRAMVAQPGSPTVCLHTFPLQFGQWVAKFGEGESLVTTDVEQVPDACWPPELKCRSRMHYYLADLEARRRCPGSRALMLNDAGEVLEATTANVVLYRKGEGLVMPPAEHILPGISQAVLCEIAAELGQPVVHRSLPLGDVAGADEVFLTSTSPCMLPVVRLNESPIGSGRPGAFYQTCLESWNRRVGLDIAAQARRFASR